MSDIVIPDAVKAFILQYIDSVATLGALLLMRSHPKQTWHAGLLAQRLYISSAQTTVILKALTQAGLIKPALPQTDHYLYGPAKPENAERVEQLAEVYARCLIPVTNLIHQRGSQNRSLQMFADAFKLTKDKET